MLTILLFLPFLSPILPSSGRSFQNDYNIFQEKNFYTHALLSSQIYLFTELEQGHFSKPEPTLDISILEKKKEEVLGTRLPLHVNRSKSKKHFVYVTYKQLQGVTEPRHNGQWTMDKKKSKRLFQMVHVTNIFSGTR